MTSEQLDSINEFLRNFKMDATTVKMWGYINYNEPAPCKHQPIDNGTRKSECKLCKVAMEFVNMEWVAMEQPLRSNNIATDSASGFELKGLAAWMPSQGTAAYDYNVNRFVRLGDNDND